MLAHYDQQEGLELNTEWPNQQLYHVRSLNLDGLALAVVQILAVEAKTRGVNAWVEITKGHLVATGQRMASTPTPCSSVQVGRVPSDNLNVELRPL